MHGESGLVLFAREKRKDFCVCVLSKSACQRDVTDNDSDLHINVYVLSSLYWLRTMTFALVLDMLSEICYIGSRHQALF